MPPFSRARLLGDVFRMRGYCRGRSALYERALTELEGSLAVGAPRWFAKLERAWAGRAFDVYYEAPTLLLSALHREALLGADPFAAPVPFLDAAPAAFFERLKDARVQTNEINRSVAWLLGACAAFRSRGLPFHLVDLGCSAGLGLAGDHWPRGTPIKPAPPPGLDDSPYPVLSRLGLDAAPVDLSDPEQRLWLRSCVWAGDKVRLERLERAVALFLDVKERLKIRLERASFAQMPAAVARALPPKAGEGLLLYNSLATDYLDDAAYEALRGGLARELSGWAGRLLWVELEPPRDRSSEDAELRFHRLTPQGLRSKRAGAWGKTAPELVLSGDWSA